MFNENPKWNYDYVRLACDSGFTFDRHKTVDFDKNKISLIDIDRIILEKDVATVEKFIPCVVQFVLDAEQAQILDDNFVKIFRVSQLSIEYLLFCKKYLDDSLERVKEDFLKLKEENKELNVFAEELKEHIAALMREIKEKNKVVQYKCEHCNKIFSSEEFLNSHIKRRHSTQTNPPLEAEADKLHLEIKELKGRLNSAEKMIQRDQMNVQPMHEKESENESRKIDELQQKFEELRLQVQSELKVLQTQHNFQEKYEKLFEKMTLESLKGHVDKGGGDLLKRRESTTQTDIESSPKKTTHPDVQNKENIPEVENAQKQITEFGEALETKVTSSLQKIENQMQSFWGKLNEMEIHRKNSEQEVGENQVPPPVKPRSKYTMTSPPTGERGQNVDKSHERKLLKKTQKEENVQVTKAIETTQVRDLKNVTAPAPLPRKAVTPQIESISKASSSEITSSDSETAAEPPVKPPSRAISAKRKRTLPKAEKMVVDEELFQYFKEEVEKIVIMGRLQDLGVSPDWKGLPTRSFNRALEIVNHQANLMKKTHPDFDLLSANLEKEVAKKLKEITSKKMKEKTIKDEVKKKVNIASKKGSVASPQIEIKNRKMYDTDSDSEVAKISKVKENLKQFSAPYSAVIEELKSVTTKLEASDSSVKEDEIMKNEDQTKGVLKNYPSVGSLTKKKVLFNLDGDHKLAESRDGGSTTSVASSVLDGTPRKNHKINKDKDIEDLSDFDFSDM